MQVRICIFNFEFPVIWFGIGKGSKNLTWFETSYGEEMLDGIRRLESEELKEYANKGTIPSSEGGWKCVR
jgi:hypothetical protein